MFFLKQFLFALLSTIGFAILFSIPKDSILRAGLVGAIGWTIFSTSSLFFKSTIAGTFFAALTVGILGEFLAKHYKKPATIYTIPGIIPLVPGAGMYYTMLALVENEFLTAGSKGTETFFIAAAISIGIIVSASLARSLNRVKNKI